MIRAARTAGFTLIEVVLSMFVLLIGATAILGMLAYGAGTARTSGLRAEATAALPSVILELEETLFPLVAAEDGYEYAGAPVPARSGVSVTGYPSLSYAYEARPVPLDEVAEAAGELPLEYVVDVSIAWREGGQRRSVDYTTLLLREVPFGERLRQRFVEGREPLTEAEHEALLRDARQDAEEADDPAGSAPTGPAPGGDPDPSTP